MKLMSSHTNKSAKDFLVVNRISRDQIKTSNFHTDWSTYIFIDNLVMLLKLIEKVLIGLDLLKNI